MCGRYTIPFTGNDLEARFELSQNMGHFEPTYNASPGQMLPVITKNSPLTASLMKWRFFPPWENWTKPKRPLINIRDDKGLTGYAKKEFAETRCLIPAVGYYEWRKFTLDGKEAKQPYYFQLKDGEIFSFGGLYQIKKDAEGKEFSFFAIITVEPNSLQKPIHDRMPLLIDKKDEERWLDSDKPMDLVKPYDPKKMEVWRVPNLVSSYKNDGPQLVEKIPDNQKEDYALDTTVDRLTNRTSVSGMKSSEQAGLIFLRSPHFVLRDNQINNHKVQMEKSDTFRALDAMIRQGWILKQYSEFEHLLDLFKEKNLITEAERKALIELAKKKSLDKLDDQKLNNQL